MKIAIIGGGIAGMVAAYLLHEDHDITLFEANDAIGGHTHTVDVPVDGTTYAVDTGFIVWNEVTYPNFLKLMTKLGVAHQSSSMTFSVLKEAQVQGDHQALLKANRRVIRFHLGDDVVPGLRLLAEALN